MQSVRWLVGINQSHLSSSGLHNSSVNSGVKNLVNKALTTDSKIIRALAIILAIFLCLDCQFLSSHDYFEQYEAWRLRLYKYLFHKSALDMSFLTRIVASARIVLQPTVRLILLINDVTLKNKSIGCPAFLEKYFDVWILFTIM